MSGTEPALKERLRADLTTSIKERDKVRSGTIRMVLSAISEAEVAGTEAIELSDQQVLDVVIREAKKRREAEEAYAAAGRTELAEQEQAESAVLADYLPQPLSAERDHRLVADAIAQTGAAELGPQGHRQGDGRGDAADQGQGRRRRRWRRRSGASSAPEREAGHGQQVLRPDPVGCDRLRSDRGAAASAARCREPRRQHDRRLLLAPSFSLFGFLFFLLLLGRDHGRVLAPRARQEDGAELRDRLPRARRTSRRRRRTAAWCRR